MRKFYITTAIDYVNSRPHLGTAYEKICADVIARYQRLRGTPTYFLMGNDEHSINVYRRARELGLEPLAYCDQMEQEFRDVWRRLEISFDDFIRTTEPRHKTGVRALLDRIRAAGDIYEGLYEGWYCPSCESFKQEKDLVDGLCPTHGLKPDWIREKNFFFRLSRYRDALLRLFEERPSFLEPEIRRNEILRLIEGGLEDISISRAGQPWGIPLEFAPGATVYVWFDALINYISAVGYGRDRAQFDRWWPADLHVVGKDITRFHAVIWPAMLMSAGVSLPRQVFGHGWVHFKGERMSKTLGTVVDPLDAASRFGPDPLRLYLVREVPFGADGDFSWERFEERYNADLANNLGNLVNRIAAMAGRYCGGRLEPAAEAAEPLAAVAARSTAAYAAAMEGYGLHEAAAQAFRLVDAINEFLNRSEPWVLARQAAGRTRVNAILFAAAEALRIAGVLLAPIMPRSAAEIRRRMGDPVGEVPFERAASWIGEGTRAIVAADLLWPRLG
jgi:methionyl-tRNA synthetase